MQWYHINNNVSRELGGKLGKISVTKMVLMARMVQPRPAKGENLTGRTPTSKLLTLHFALTLPTDCAFRKWPVIEEPSPILFLFQIVDILEVMLDREFHCMFEVPTDMPQDTSATTRV